MKKIILFISFPFVLFATDWSPSVATYDTLNYYLNTLMGRGDTLIVPDDTVNIATEIVITQGCVIKAKTDTSKSVLTNTNTGEEWNYIFSYQPDSTARTDNNLFEIYDIQFRTAQGEYQAILEIEADDTSHIPTRILIHNNRFNGDGNYIYKAIEFNGAILGVVYENDFINVKKVINGYGNYKPTWDYYYPAALGDSVNIYLEDNVITNTTNDGSTCCSGVVSTGDGGKMVVRFNTWNNVLGYSLGDAHGNQTSGVVGSVLQEFYYNTVSDFTESHKLFDLRGGVGLIYLNTSTPNGGYSQDFTIRDEYTDALAPDVEGIEHVHDSYLFKNLTILAEITYTHDIDVDNVVDINEDYWVYDASFDGSAGVGYGTVAAMNEITATKDSVGFWVTNGGGDWNTLNESSNDGALYLWYSEQWNLYYTPYTYPNPLRHDYISPEEQETASQKKTDVVEVK